MGGAWVTHQPGGLPLRFATAGISGSRKARSREVCGVMFTHQPSPPPMINNIMTFLPADGCVS